MVAVLPPEKQRPCRGSAWFRRDGQRVIVDPDRWTTIPILVPDDHQCMTSPLPGAFVADYPDPSAHPTR
jgi:hypothetical protein